MRGRISSSTGKTTTSTKLKDTKKKVSKEQNEIEMLLVNKSFKSLLFEDWVQCDSCKKWRKIHDESLLKKKKFFCNDVGNMNCTLPEENLKAYVTLSEQSK